MGIFGDYLEARNAALYTLRDHDEELRRMKARPGKVRKQLVENISELGAEAWTFNEGPWF